MDDEQIVKARLKDLAERAYRQNVYTYSNFLTPAELTFLEELKEDIRHIPFSTFGGGEACDRRMVGFGSEALFGYESKFPISIVKVEPLIEKFSDQLNHRDFLGAIMNLGIERSIIGDILVKDGKRAYIYCSDSIANFICENLLKIKHTNVRCTVMELSEDLAELRPEFKDISVVVASPRFDAIVAGVTKLSRNDALNLFKAKKVTLNGRLCEKNSITIKDGDTFSLRGYGKYIYEGCGNETRKGRVYVHLKQYV